MTQNISVRKATSADLNLLWEMALAMGVAKADGYFDKSIELQDHGERVVLIASLDGQDAGYCMLSWAPKYALFRKLEIPEIQDLNVLPDFRCNGVGGFMIDHCEGLARDAGKLQMEIGVGMDASYGVAQQLYIRRGYVPDGNGLTYDRKPIAKGEFRPIDDEMSLMLTKDLQID